MSNEKKDPYAYILKGRKPTREEVSLIMKDWIFFPPKLTKRDGCPNCGNPDANIEEIACDYCGQ